MDRLKILVVDDESRMRKLVKDFLIKNQFDVLEAEDGEQALDIFFNEKDKVGYTDNAYTKKTITPLERKKTDVRT